jgi:hypothetical protein
MKYRFVLWGRKEDEPNWKDVILTETEDKYRLNKLVIWAKESNYKYLKVMVFNQNNGEFIKQYYIE